MSKKVLIIAVTALLAVAMTVGISLAVVEWRVDSVNTVSEANTGAWNAAVKDMVFEPVLANGAAVAYKLTAYNGIMNSITVPDYYSPDNTSSPLPVTIIGQAFTRVNGLVSLTLPATLQTIEDNALRACKHLKKVEFNSVTTIGATVLSGCNNLETVWLPNTLRSIGEGALSTNAKLRNIDFEGANNSVKVGLNALRENNVTGGNCVITYGIPKGARHE